MKKNRLIFKSLMISGAIALPLISVVACSKKEENQNTVDASSIINVNKQLKFDYKGNKADILASAVTKENIEVSGYNKEEFEVNIVSVSPALNLENAVEVTYKIKDLKKNLTSSELRFVISGFKSQK
ncbi:hypothetical protein ACXYFN_01090 [Mycoplasma sp. 48589B]